MFSQNIRKERIFTNKKTRNIIIAVAVLLVLVIGALLVWQHFKPAAQEGGKGIVVTVVHGDGSQKDFTIRTDAEFLRGALEEQKLISSPPLTARRQTATCSSGGASPRAVKCS